MTDPSLGCQAQRTATWRAWILLALIAPLLLLAVSTAAVFLIVARAGGDSSVIPSQLRAWFPYIVMVNHTVLFLIAVRLARSDGISFEQLGWKQTQQTWLLDLAIGLVAGVVIFGIQSRLAEPAVAAIRASLQVGSLRPRSTPVLTLNLASLIAGTVLAGVVEETVYRGYIQRRMTARLGNALGILVTTLGFAAGLHWGLGPWSLIIVFLNGLLLALLFEWRKTLLPCALAHAVVNALVVIL